jgi:glycosyltransferase involved in cell wall biosynthesis
MKTIPSFIPIHATVRGNDFMIDVARILSHGLTEAGIPNEVRLDTLPERHSDDALPLVIAPHEFFPLFVERVVDRETAERMSREVAVVNVEQPGSPWFEVAAAYAGRSRGALDISRVGAAELRARGVHADHVPLRYAPFLEADFRAPVLARPIDILFLGYHSRRREQFFAQHAEAFAPFQTRLVFANVSEPRRQGTPGYYAGQTRASLIASSKIVLNVHGLATSYFEAHRAALALANECLFVSETSAETAPLIPGRHFAMADLDHLPALCVDYLSRPEDLARTAAAGRELIRQADRFDYRRVLARIPQPIDGREAAAAGETGRRGVRTRLAASLERRGQDQGQDWEGVTNTAYGSIDAPAVSVLITLFNYESFISDCLASVAASHPISGGIEIVVIDDGSTDGSAARASAIVGHSSVPGIVVRKTSNTGLADARNVGLRLARGRWVFILDADNVVFPSCLSTLCAAIQTGSYSAAYGLIRRFDSETGEGLGLASVFAWDRRQQVRGPYVDAMALLDRSAVERVGGYSTELIDHGWFGWEDYDLWLKLCRAGAAAVVVPTVLSSYRVHPASMIRRTNRYSLALATYFVKKFADLVAEFPGEDRYFGFPARALGITSEPASTPVLDPLALRQQCENLEAELNDVYASKSWRVTAPLRAALGLITGKPGRR